ncbi:regulator of Vps4 activity in the MVB pathway-domain-containing protein [Pseudoneurospora amorphoporcata]|uniref:Regulator of Vps4 activity in the MVB pathway-domain-containing protein n=1 Tax=Pseudoneurospora amorphoporcata TaxID=241081 RepID=A0AAN6SCI8_9PEZI|nr:regulator of Vps4 activity in the MVB pathway-domain-containing protein [Pseudoneurospora amorphoporcata]
MPPAGAAFVAKLKVQLKLAIARLRMVQKRDEALAKTQRRAMAQLLDVGKEDSARIRVENIIRSDITTELHEILELYCELLLARAGLLEAPTCDPGLEEAVKSIIYAAPKTEIKELHQVRTLLAEKFGKEFALQAVENSDGKVSEKVVKKLSVTPPREELVVGYLEEIAKVYGVNWPKKKADLGDPPDFMDDDENPSGGQAQKNLEAPLKAEDKEAEAQEELSKATPPVSFGPASPLHINPPPPSTDNIHPKVTLNHQQLQPKQPSASGGVVKKAPAKGGIADGIPEVDELAKRFAALKK